MAKGPESKVKDDVKAYLESIGAYWYMPVPVGFGRPTLDFLVCWRGRFIGIETKAPGKHATTRQKLTIKQIQAAGGTTLVVSSIRDMQEYFEYVA
jgi:hypothetical protein